MALMIGIAGTTLSPAETRQLRDPAVCGVILFTRNFVDGEQLRALCAVIRGVRGDLLIAVDQEGGRVQRFRGPGFTALPPLSVVAATWDTAPAATLKALREHARTIADEVQGHDLDLSFTPVLDLGLGNRAIGDRALSADPKVCARLGAVYVRALQRAGMAATIKHFPGHGSILEDTHHEIAIDARPLEVIAMRDLLPFAAGIRAGARAVMMAHVRYPQVDPVAAGYSTRWIHGVLREALSFRGAVISDDIGMAAAFEAGGLDARIRDHEAAGCDIVLVCDAALVPEALATGTSRPLKPRLARLLRGRRRLDWTLA